jgi:hypothetical protein
VSQLIAKLQNAFDRQVIRGGVAAKRVSPQAGRSPDFFRVPLRLAGAAVGNEAALDEQPQRDRRARR